MTLHRHLATRLIGIADRRPPDFVIGGAERPYLRRWYLIRRNGAANAYLHHFLRPDDDRALHDHPWASVSILLRGAYVEHTPQGAVLRHAPGCVLPDVLLASTAEIEPPILLPWVAARRASAAHRVELLRDAGTGEHLPCWTLFLTGPRVREWGFHCPQGWVHWRKFTNPADGGRTVGPGCDQ